VTTGSGQVLKLPQCPDWANIFLCIMPLWLWPPTFQVQA